MIVFAVRTRCDSKTLTLVSVGCYYACPMPEALRSCWRPECYKYGDQQFCSSDAFVPSYYPKEDYSSVSLDDKRPDSWDAAHALIVIASDNQRASRCDDVFACFHKSI